MEPRTREQEPTIPPLKALEPFKVPNLPPVGYYIPNFLTEEEEAYLLGKIEQTPQPKWKTVGSGRRLQYWGGTLTKKNILVPEQMPDFLSAYPHIIDRIDAFLDAAAGYISNDEFFSRAGARETGISTSTDSASPAPPNGQHALGINQVLINEYQPGQGIAPHEDGAAFKPLVATLSLGSHTVLDLYHYINPTSPSPPMVASEGEGKTIAAVPLGHVLLLPRSLFILTGSLYSSHLHGIAEREVDCVVAPQGDRDREGGGQGEGSHPGAVLAETEGMNEGEANRPTLDHVVAANAALLAAPDIQDALASPEGWTARRGTRVSLTFRQAEKTLKGGAFGMVGGRLQRH